MGHRNRSGLGEFPIKAGSSRQAIELLFSAKLLAQPPEFEESGFATGFS
jgi:hypothetical protein